MSWYTIWTTMPTNTAMALCAVLISYTILLVRWPAYVFYGLVIVILLIVLTLGNNKAKAATECTTRKSGSVTIETCTNTRQRTFVQCRSYMSGSVRKKTCRD